MGEAMTAQLISIHAPRAGSDAMDGSLLKDFLIISIHAPRAGSDGATARGRRCGRVFQSTLPVRGATKDTQTIIALLKNFNPRSPCGERLLYNYSLNYTLTFQSTLPVRGATVKIRIFIRIFK